MDKQENFYPTFELLRKHCSNRLYLKKNDNGCIIIRSDIKDSSEAAEFVQAFEFVTQSRFMVYQTRPPMKFEFNRRLRCFHRIRRKRFSNLTENCPAEIHIVIKKNTRCTRYKDGFLKMKPPLPAVITIKSQHNHPITDQKSLKLLKVSKDVKLCFYEYFKNNIIGIKAKRIHEQNLRKANFESLDDASMNPRMRTIYRLYHEWRKLNGMNKLKRGAAAKLRQLEQELNPEDSFPSPEEENCGFLNVKELVSKITRCEIESDEDAALEKIADQILDDLERDDDHESEREDLESEKEDHESCDSKDETNESSIKILSYGSVVFKDPNGKPVPIDENKVNFYGGVPIRPKEQPSIAHVMLYNKSTNSYRTFNIIVPTNPSGPELNSNQTLLYIPCVPQLPS